MKVIDLFSYLDPNQFLQDYYRSRKLVEKGFSYEKWAKELGVSSRSYLRQWVCGERDISTKFIPQLVSYLQLNEKEQEYFSYLIQMKKSKTEEEREYYFSKVNRLYKVKDSRVKVVENNHFLYSYLVPRLQVLLNDKESAMTSYQLAEILDEQESTIENLLQQMHQEGFAEKETYGEEVLWFSHMGQFFVPTENQSGFIREFHKQSLAEAVEAIDGKHPSERHYESAVINLTEQEYSLVIKKLGDSLQDILDEYRDKPLENKRIYQINTNIIPVSQKIEFKKKQNKK